VLFAALAANIAVAVLVRAAESPRYRQLTDLTSPQLQVVQTARRKSFKKEEYRTTLEKTRDDMKHLAGEVLSTRQRRMIGVQLEIAKLAKEFSIALERVQYETKTSTTARWSALPASVPLAGG